MEFRQWKRRMFDREFVVEHGKVARQSAGSAYIRAGDTVILVVANAANEPRGGDFLPLTVEFQEKFYSAGKIPGGFLKREGRPGESSILAARQIDRPIRPLFGEGFSNEVQVIATVFSMDPDNPADVLAIMGASLALNLSNIPFEGIVAGVKMGFVDGQPVVFPSEEQLKNSLLDLTVAGTKEAIVMVEGEGKEVDEELMIQALEAAHKAIVELVTLQEEIIAELGIPEKMEYEVPTLSEANRQTLEELIDIPLLEERIFTQGKKARDVAVGEYKKQVMEVFEEKLRNLELEEDVFAQQFSLAKAHFEDVMKKRMRRNILEKNRRADSRPTTGIRNIECEIGVLPRTHGSALFTRGETQSLGIVTLGDGSDTQLIDTIYQSDEKAFMLHYNFPPFSVGEVKPMRGVSRREVGHGHLAERSVKFVLPNEEAFPYTIRVVSEILESNGSSSMATICSASLSLMDAGVPISKHVAGVAMGLIKEEDGVAVLTDILGLEDHLGDMDFKVAGTRDGITGFQMDIKVSGISSDIMKQALLQAKEARLHILDLMYSAIPSHREELSPYAPAIVQIQIPYESIGELIGPGGKTIKRITKDFEVNVNVEDDSGKVSISGTDREKVRAALKFVETLTRPIQAGEEFEGKITRVEKYGVFVEMAPGKVGLLHASNMGRRVPDATKEFKIGDTMKVYVASVDENGKYDLKKILTEEEKKQAEKEKSERGSARPNSNRPPRPQNRRPRGKGDQSRNENH
ncbi:MAG TPA: polyribonucleotide nucleotidyltransferase [Thermotogota bacterium]|nr:polyribonucleotide nucleotidyltransferase [Thermotogota bacterium]